LVQSKRTGSGRGLSRQKELMFAQKINRKFALKWASRSFALNLRLRPGERREAQAG